MLDDTTRKVLRILYNKYRFEEFKLDVSLIARYSMRSEDQVKAAVNELVKIGYVRWHKERNTFELPFQAF